MPFIAAQLSAFPHLVTPCNASVTPQESIIINLCKGCNGVTAWREGVWRPRFKVQGSDFKLETRNSEPETPLPLGRFGVFWYGLGRHLGRLEAYKTPVNIGLGRWDGLERGWVGARTSPALCRLPVGSLCRSRSTSIRHTPSDGGSCQRSRLSKKSQLIPKTYVLVKHMF